VGAGARAQKVEPRLEMSTLVGFVTIVDSLGAVRMRPPRTIAYVFYNYPGIYFSLCIVRAVVISW
jgi:hypothetical protein